MPEYHDDCDTGMDDALALLLALRSPEFKSSASPALMECHTG